MSLVLTVDAWWQRTDIGLRLHRRGDELTVDAETEAWLRKHRLAADADEVEVKEEAPKPEPVAEKVAEPEPVEKPEPVAEKVAEPEPVEKPVRAQKPAKAAPVDEWRAYAKSAGVDPAGLSKAEIIAATR